jgi:hypothetical protein
MGKDFRSFADGQSLVKAFAEGLITEETALTYCSQKARMRRELDHLGKWESGWRRPAPG